MASFNTSRSAITVLVAATTLFTSTAARAETGTEKAKAPAKGTVGLAFLGAEAVVAVEALVGVKPWWGYAVGGGLGAIAGGVGGYFIDKMDKPAVSMGLLAGGLTLAVPTAVAVLSATTYKPPANPEVDTAARKAREDLALMQAIVARHALAHRRQSGGWVNVNQNGRLNLSMPELSVVSVYSQREEQIAQLVYRKNAPNAPSFRSVVLNLSF